MFWVIETIATLIGYFVLASIAFAVTMGVLWKHASADVDPEVKQMAKEVDPNSPIPNTMKEQVMQGVIDSIGELGPDETLRSDPQPITHFDWSIKSRDSRQEHIEHILQTLAREGYHVQPLPEKDRRKDVHTWSKQLAGVWLNEPDWHIEEWDDEDREFKVVEEIDVPIPTEWKPKGVESE